MIETLLIVMLLLVVAMTFLSGLWLGLYYKRRELMKRHATLAEQVMLVTQQKTQFELQLDLLARAVEHIEGTDDAGRSLVATLREAAAEGKKEGK